MTLLSAQNLSICIGDKRLVDGINLTLEAGETLGIVGESGSGKSLTALSLMGLLPHSMAQSGTIHFAGRPLNLQDERAMQRIRGRHIGMIFQEPMTALNPLKTIGVQVSESLRWHLGINRKEAEAKAKQILDRVGLPPAKFPLSRYPHQLSGGQRQRVVIAIACIMEPQLLIADEPTTALDVVLQAQIMDLLADLTDERKMGLILISHDLGVMAQMADNMLVMRHGKVIETAPLGHIFSGKAAPYTQELAHAHQITTKITQPETVNHDDILTIDRLTKSYRGKRVGLFKRQAPFKAVDNVTFALKAGETTALVGQSGCGKSTLARAILALEPWQSGTITINGTTLAPNQAMTPSTRRNVNIVFQDPYGSFDPRHNIERIITEPLHLLGALPEAEKRQRAQKVLAQVDMTADCLNRYPHQFSGGQRQRIAIARAMITEPKLIIADEPVSALDVSVRATILDLFNHLTGTLGIACIFITHDLNVARAVAETIMVMDQGKIVEQGITSEILRNPQSVAAKALVKAAPNLAQALQKRGIILEHEEHKNSESQHGALRP